MTEFNFYDNLTPNNFTGSVIRGDDHSVFVVYPINESFDVTKMKVELFYDKENDKDDKTKLARYRLVASTKVDLPNTFDNEAVKNTKFGSMFSKPITKTVDVIDDTFIVPSDITLRYDHDFDTKGNNVVVKLTGYKKEEAEDYQPMWKKGSYYSINGKRVNKDEFDQAIKDNDWFDWRSFDKIFK